MIDFKRNPYSYEDLKADADRLQSKYKDLIQNVTVGCSHDNRDILLLKVGYGKKFLLCTGGVHGRESINPIVLMKLIECYAKYRKGYPKLKTKFQSDLTKNNRYLKMEYNHMIYSSLVTEFLDIYTILFLPLINPDGYEIALGGFDKIRDERLRELCLRKHEKAAEWKYNARAVDLNRNFPSRYWIRKIIDTDTMHAQKELESETKALIQVFHEYEPMGYLDFHSRGNLIYYYRNAMSRQYNERQLFIARKLQRYTGYCLSEPELEVESGDTGGNTVHYFSEQLKKPALTIETVEDEAEFPLDPTYRRQVFEEIKFVVLGFGNSLL